MENDLLVVRAQDFQVEGALHFFFPFFFRNSCPRARAPDYIKIFSITGNSVAALSLRFAFSVSELGKKRLPGRFARAKALFPLVFFTRLEFYLIAENFFPLFFPRTAPCPSPTSFFPSNFFVAPSIPPVKDDARPRRPKQ